MASNFDTKKIDVMIVGAQKAGTTSLLYYFGEHPACLSHLQKEFGYFCDDQEYKKGYRYALKKYYSHLPYSDNTKIIAKSTGLSTNEKGLQRLKESNPACEIILILRNPVDRTYSSYLMEKNHNSVPFEFTDLPGLIKNNKEDLGDFNFLINFSLYARHLKTIYKYFPKEQVSILFYEDLKKDPLALCRNVFRQINVDVDFVPDLEVKYNVTKKHHTLISARLINRFLENKNPVKKALKMLLPGRHTARYGELLKGLSQTDENHESIDKEVRQFLIDYYKPHNKELEILIGKNLSSWNT